MIDPYEILDISRDADAATIEAAWKAAAKKYHPDVNKTMGARELFEQARAAHDILSDPAKRAEFDETDGVGPFPDVEALASNAARTSIDWAISEAERAGLFSQVDIVETAREKLRQDLVGFRQGELKSKALSARYAKLRKQVSGKFIERVVDKRERAARASARVAAHNIKIAERAIELLVDHSHTPWEQPGSAEWRQVSFYSVSDRYVDNGPAG